MLYTCQTMPRHLADRPKTKARANPSHQGSTPNLPTKSIPTKIT